MPDADIVKVLSIDGGGIRGIIPALVLADIERRTKRPASELFDLIAGTSTGGIIALGVSVPADDGKPRWSAQQIADMYVNDGGRIFHHSLLRTIETVGGLVEERYEASGLEAVLKGCLGEARLSQSLTDLLVTSYDIQSHEPFFFKSFRPRAHTRTGSRDLTTGLSLTSDPAQATDFPMRLVGRATSAAPTYFEPEHIRAPAADGTPADYALVDGGTFANNPAMCAYAEAKRNRPDSDVLIVSLGTGRPTESISFEQARRWGLVQWARPLLGVIMDGSSAAIDYQLDELLGADETHFRFQTVLNGVSDSLDDARPENIAGLRKLALDSIEEDEARLKRVCDMLVR